MNHFRLSNDVGIHVVESLCGITTERDSHRFVSNINGVDCIACLEAHAIQLQRDLSKVVGMLARKAAHQ